MSNVESAIYLCSGETMEDAIKRTRGSGKQLLAMQLSRREIESGLIGDAVDRLMTLSDSKEHTLLFADSLLVYMDGYDDDPRELFEIPQAVSFFRAVTREWPYWLHFCLKRPDALGVILNLLVDVRIEARTAQRVGICTVAPDGYQTEMQNLFHGMNLLYLQHRLPMKDAFTMTNKVMDTFYAFLENEK